MPLQRVGEKPLGAGRLPDGLRRRREGPNMDPVVSNGTLRVDNNISTSHAVVVEAGGFLSGRATRSSPGAFIGRWSAFVDWEGQSGESAAIPSKGNRNHDADWI